ncbi:MAG TPA: MlaD family protein [Conexibacter sp.]|jgi:phospholipid/cholesterol/gamma-HCH transport system substrate-binding protein|nr:MlaD family protein [Conexibacter sp.]
MSSRVSPTVKRALAGGLLLVAALVVLVLGTGASGNDGGSYRVRAIFDSASFLVPGEDVKIAGVKVGTIESLDVTPDNKAAIVLRIDDPAFQDFKQDAHCTIRLQSLIGEKFVACDPTQPKGANSAPAPSLQQIARGDGKGEYLLPVTNTSAPVDLDMLNNIMRLPERQRFAIIVNELGVGLAGNGEQLNAVIRRADPALYQLDRVLAILASQNRVLANLARESDAALAPVARQSSSISDFIDKAGVTATATAARGNALEQNFAKLPAFLQQLRPTVRRLGEFAAAGTPVVRDLRVAAPSVNTLFEQLGPFSTAALPTFRTLGNLADTGSRALPAAEPIIRDIRGFADAAKPFSRTLANGLTSLQAQHGIQRLLDVILFTTGTTNGFDVVGHYLRTFLTVPVSCLPYAVVQVVGCQATFTQARAASSTTPTPPAGALAASSTTASSGSASLVDAPPATSGPGTAPAGQAPAAQAPAGSGLLGYLLGSGAR